MRMQRNRRDKEKAIAEVARQIELVLNPPDIDLSNILSEPSGPLYLGANIVGRAFPKMFTEMPGFGQEDLRNLNRYWNERATGFSYGAGGPRNLPGHRRHESRMDFDEAMTGITLTVRDPNNGGGPRAGGSRAHGSNAGRSSAGGSSAGGSNGRRSNAGGSSVGGSSVGGSSSRESTSRGHSSRS